MEYKNLRELSNYLDQNYSHTPVHISKDAIKELKYAKQPLVDLKPYGLWYTYGNKWLKFVRENMQDIYRQTNYIYTFDIDNNKEIYGVNSEKKLRNIIDKYKAPEKYLKKFDPMLMSWYRVQKDYSGVEFKPYDWKLARKLYRENGSVWYFTIDIDSGCIWDPKIIKNLKLIAEYDKKKKKWLICP